MEKKIVSVLLLVTSLCFPTFIFAETVILKSGKKIEGKIIERTDKYIKIDFNGVPLPYFFDEIEKIETERNLSYPPRQEERPQQAETIDSHFKRGTDYLIEGKWQEAISEFKNVLSVNANHVGAHFNLGCVYALIGENEFALEEFEKSLSIEIVPYNAFCYFNKAGIYTKKGLIDMNAERFKEETANFQRAAENFQKTAEILPHFDIPVDFGVVCKSLADSPGKLELVFAVKKDYPPNSCLFLAEKDIMDMGTGGAFVFKGNTVPMLYFWHSSTVETIIGVSYALREKVEEADKFLDQAMEKLSFELIRYKRWVKPRLIIGPREVSVSKERNDAISALTSFLKGEYEKTEELAKQALSGDPKEKIAKNVLEALRLLKEGRR